MYRHQLNGGFQPSWAETPAQFSEAMPCFKKLQLQSVHEQSFGLGLKFQPWSTANRN